MRIFGSEGLIFQGDVTNVKSPPIAYEKVMLKSGQYAVYLNGSDWEAVKLNGFDTPLTDITGLELKQQEPAVEVSLKVRWIETRLTAAEYRRLAFLAEAAESPNWSEA